MSKWGIHRAGEAKAASQQRQFVRWLMNSKIEHAQICPPLVNRLCGLGQHQIYLALDSRSL